MKLAVIYESLTGNTRRAAELIGRHAAASGASVSVRPVTDIDHHALATSDLVMVGTWTDGFIFFGQRPGRAGRLWNLPVLDRKPAVVFCTYAIDCGHTLDKMQAILEARGAHVLGGRAIRRDRLDTEIPGFVDDSLDLVAAP